MRTLNFRLLLLLFVGFAVASLAIYFLHAVQVTRQSDAYLLHATEAKEMGNLPEAIDHLSRYLDVAPENTEAMEQLGELLVQTRRWNEAFSVLEQTLRREPDRVESRLRLAEVSLALGRFSDAKEQLEQIIASSAADAETYLLLAACHSANGQWRSAADACEDAIKKDSANIAAYQQLAALQRSRLDDPAASEATIDQVVSANPTNAEAWVLRGAWRLQYRDSAATQSAIAKSQEVSPRVGSIEVLSQASDDAEKAIQLDPMNADAVRLAASILLVEKDYAAARKLADKAIEIAPEASASYVLRAQIEAAAENPERASHWLKKGIQFDPGNLALVWALGNSLLDQQELAEVEQVIRMLHDAGYESARIRFLKARVAIAEQKWLKASELLEACLPSLIETSDLAKQGHYLQANCYRQLRRPELEVAALKKVVAIDPNWSQPRQELSVALAKLGRADEAADHMRRVASASKTEQKKATVEIIQMIDSMAGRAVADRDWEAVHRKIDQQLKEGDDPLIRILKAQAYLRQNELELAQDVLRQARAAHPQHQELWLSSILLSMRTEQWDEVDLLLADAEKAIGSPLPLRLMQARVLAARDEMESRERLLQLAVAPDGYDLREKVELLVGIGDTFRRIGGVDEAQQLFQAAGQLAPSNLMLRLSLFDLAFRQKDLDAMEAALRDVKSIDGDGPYWKYGEALRLSMKSSKENSPALLDQAETLLLGAHKELSTLRQIPLLLGRISESKGKIPQAAVYYLEAFDAGEREASVVERLLAVLLHEQKSSELQRVVAQLRQEGIPQTDAMKRIIAEHDLRQGNYADAIKQGRELVKNSDGVQEHLWLGQSLARNGQIDEARQEVERAIELAPEQSDAWIAKIKLLQATGKKEAFQEAVDKANAAVKSLPLSIVIAQAHLALEGAESAEVQFSKLLNENPNSAEALQAAIQFELHVGRREEAQRLLEKLVDLAAATKEQQRWGRRNLASLAAASGKRSGIDEAKTLLQTNLTEGNEAADQFAMARVLASAQDPQSRKEAISILEVARGERTLSLDERYLLADFYFMDSNFEKADALMRDLIAAAPENQLFLRRFIQELIQREQTSEAEVWLNRLKRLSPGDIATIRVEASLYLHRDAYVDVTKSLTDFAAKPPEDAIDETAEKRWKFATASLLDEFAARLRHQGADAELIRRLTDLSQTLWRETLGETPKNQSLLALQAARRGDVDVALHWLQDSPSGASPGQLAVIGSTIASSGLASDPQLRQLDETLEKIIAGNSNSLELTLLQADLKGRLGQISAAIDVYREVLAKDEKNVLILNNLAALLAMQGASAKESLQQIDKAIELAGSNVNFLDTRAMALIALGQYPEAVAEAERSVAYRKSAANLFHLAWAHHAQRQEEEAKRAFQEAERLGLLSAQVHPLELPAYQQLRRLNETANGSVAQ
ncbi:tetratricopeptide repeat protein [Blastopirellula marina]|uniref:TPR domain protein n=1 Tax=Blastopirellula marina DSM 3645 TaxID=314230 RepID=A3ZP05_9BACT|nr:tetratricopeptide repeat protein [Blastopirellula marina]EAQ81552.1 TPR domain protein [Blastopirellula marina DSM 3645]